MDNRTGLGIVLIIFVMAILAFVYTQNSASTGIYHTTKAVTTSFLSTTIATTTIQTTTVMPAITANNSSSSSAPVVKIITPQNLSTVNRGPVNISANITSASKITKVQFYVNSTLLATLNSTPYLYVWNADNVTAPEYIITVKALAANGASAQASVLVNIGLIQHGK